MKKFLSTFIVVVLVMSGIVAANVSKKEAEINEKIDVVSFSNNLELTEKDGYLSISLDGTDSSMLETGKPVLPVYRATYTYSSAVKIKGVTCTYSEINEEKINGKIIPGPRVIIKDGQDEDKDSTLIEDKDIYESESLYPGIWYEYSIRCGLNKDEVSTTFLTIEVYPVQYSPKLNTLYSIDSAKIQINYVDPGAEINKNGMESYDLVIIAPEKFSSALQSLVTHKNNLGVKTILKTTESIYQEYSGRDKPEQIKYFIKYAKETWGITYVLLVGGLASYINADDREDRSQGSEDWNVPVRYTNIVSEDEKGCISDLYYSDIYKYNVTSEQWEFDSWDSNGNNIFAEFSGSKKDIIDFAPDVYYGRLACVNTWEVKTVVKKIIKYESTSPEDKPWFRKMIGVGGKTFELYNDQPDGEYLCDVAMNFMDDLIDETVKVYASNRDSGGLVPVPKDIISAIKQGAGYVIFEGHGNPQTWDTIWADGEYPKDWTGGLNVMQMPKIFNFAKLPVVLVGGCHNALFNLSIAQILKNRKEHYNYYWVYTPWTISYCWELCIMPWGGAIASTGCTGYGIGYSGQPISLNAQLETNFYYEIGQNGVTTLGGAHSGSITKFITEESPIKTSDQYHCMTVYQLFGDPSLKLGGY